MIDANRVKIMRLKLLFNAKNSIHPDDVLALCESYLELEKQAREKASKKAETHENEAQG